MHNSVHRDAVEKLLSAITLEMGDDGLMSQFGVQRPGERRPFGGIGVTIYYHERELMSAVLFVRKHGPLYLRHLPTGDIWSLLQNFVTDNFWLVSDECLFRRFSGTLSDGLSVTVKQRLADSLAISQIFCPACHLHLFPLGTVSVESDFSSDRFFIISPAHLDRARLPAAFPEGDISPEVFPPVKEWRGKREIPTAWLGVQSPALKAADKDKAAILGSLALAQMSGYRYQFCGRRVFGGTCILSEDEYIVQFGESHTPPIMHDIAILPSDAAWLSLLSDKLERNDKSTRRQLRALEYYYRSWSLEPSERFPVLCMALDGIFGEVGRATQAVIDGVREVVGSHVKDARLRKIMDLRAAVIHGGAPAVYDSSKYDDYYREYAFDPIVDLDLVVTDCLRKKIFEGRMHEHPDPLEEFIRQGQAAGKLPKRLNRPTILDVEEL